MSVRTSGTPHDWVQQPDAPLSQANPVSGTLYTVLATTAKPTRIISMTVQVTWTAQPTPLEIVVTIDGQTVTYTVANPVTATAYYALNVPNLAENVQALVVAATYGIGHPFLREGSTVKVEARTTGGTTTNLTARVKYALKQV